MEFLPTNFPILMSTMSNIDIHKKAYYSVIEPGVLESLHEKVGLSFQILYKTNCLLKIIPGGMPEILDN